MRWEHFKSFRIADGKTVMSGSTQSRWMTVWWVSTGLLWLLLALVPRVYLFGGPGAVKGWLYVLLIPAVLSVAGALVEVTPSGTWSVELPVIPTIVFTTVLPLLTLWRYVVWQRSLYEVPPEGDELLFSLVSMIENIYILFLVLLIVAGVKTMVASRKARQSKTATN